MGTHRGYSVHIQFRIWKCEKAFGSWENAIRESTHANSGNWNRLPETGSMDSDIAKSKRMRFSCPGFAQEREREREMDSPAFKKLSQDMDPQVAEVILRTMCK